MRRDTGTKETSTVKDAPARCQVRHHAERREEKRRENGTCVLVRRDTGTKETSTVKDAPPAARCDITLICLLRIRPFSLIQHAENLASDPPVERESGFIVSLPPLRPEEMWSTLAKTPLKAFRTQCISHPPPCLVQAIMATMQKEMLARAVAERNGMITTCLDWAGFVPALDKKHMVLTPWCECPESEEEVKKKTTAESEGGGAKTLCIPFEQPPLPEVRGLPLTGVTQASQPLLSPFGAYRLMRTGAASRRAPSASSPADRQLAGRCGGARTSATGDSGEGVH